MEIKKEDDMKYERTKNTVRGTAFGILNRMISLLIPFLVRTILIKVLGIEYLGLGSLFSSILGVLSLAELGIGSAIVFALYRAIADEDGKTICALMAFYKKAYHTVGWIVLALGLLLIPLLPILCPQVLPDGMNIYLLYFIYLANTVLSYFMFAYKNCLLTAFQRIDISSNVGSCTNLVLYLFQILGLLLTQNYYYFVIFIPIFSIIQNIVTAYYVTKVYPQYLPHGKLEPALHDIIFRKIKALFLYRIGSVVLTSVDSIVISVFLGLSVLGQYNSYYYVVYTLFGFLQVYYNAITPGIGNSMSTETIEKNYLDFNRLNFLQSWVIGWCSICLVCLFQPFIGLWIGSEYLFSERVIFCWGVYFYLWKMMDVVNIYKEASGMWDYDKYRQIFASGVNLFLNITLVQKIGIYGVLLSTVISIAFITFPWSTAVLFKYYFKMGMGEYFKKYFIRAGVTIIVCLLTYCVCELFFSYISVWAFIGRGLICLIFPNILFWGVGHLSKDYTDTRQWIVGKVKAVF